MALPGRSAVLAQPKRLALLAYLAAASPRGFHRRDSLVALFWPELDQEHARASLRKALHALRRDLGADIVVNRGDDQVGLDWARLRCDAAEFDRLLAAGEPEAALGLYAGDLLPGLFLSGDTVEFERWLDRERDRLREAAARAAWALVERSQKSGKTAEVARWARQAASFAPTDEGVLRRVMSLLDRAGDRAGAVRVYTDFTKRLREEYETEPAAETQALLRSIQGRRDARPEGAPRPDGGAGEITPERATAPEPGPLSVQSMASAARPPVFRRRAAIVIGTAAVLLTVAIFAGVRHRTTRTTPSRNTAALPDNRPTVAVLDFSNVARDTADDYLAYGMQEGLTTLLGKVAGLRLKPVRTIDRVREAGISDPPGLGRALGARYLIEGGVRRMGPRVRVAAQLIRSTDGLKMWKAEYDAPAADLLSLEDSIAERVAARVAGDLSAAERVAMSRRMTSNPEAYDHYLRGNYALARRTPRSVARAGDEYDSALRLDSAFTEAMARKAYGDAFAGDRGWSVRGQSGAQLIHEGMTLSDRALRQDSSLAEAWVARGYLLAQEDPKTLAGSPEAFQRALALDSTEAETYHKYGEVLMTLGRDAEAEAAFHQALRLEPARSETLVLLMVLAWDRGRPEEAHRLIDSAVSVDPTAADAYVFRASLRIATADPLAAAADADAALRLDSSYAVPARAMLASARAAAGDTAAARRELALAVADGRHSTRPSPTDAAFVGLGYLAIAKPDEAVEFIERSRPRGATLWWYLRHPGFDPLRGNARFERVVSDSRPPGAPPVLRGSSVAVLPFVNRSSDPGEDYFVDGMTDEITGALASLPGLGVAARTSAYSFKDKSEDVRQIAEQLGVDLVLEGSVRRDGDRVRVLAQLVDARTGYQLWAQAYDRDTRDLFAVQEEIARTIADTLRLRAPGDGRGTLVRGRTSDVQAHDLYLKGRYAWALRTRDGLLQAARYFEEAVGRDPSYAAAYAGLADAHLAMGSFGVEPPEEAMPKAKAAADRALALDSMLAEAHTSRAAIIALADRDLPAADAEYRRSIELKPSYATAHHWRALVLDAEGRFDEGLAEMRRAQALDPLSLSTNSALGALLYFARDYDEAVAQLRRTLVRYPTSAAALTNLGAALVGKGSYAEAVTTLKAALQKVPGDPETMTDLAAAYARSGRRAEAERILAQLKSAPEKDRSFYHIGVVEGILGDRDAAFRSLAKSGWSRDALVDVVADPLLDPLRSDPRYGTLLRTLRIRR